MEKIYFIQLNGEMILANGGFENGLFKMGNIENNRNWSERLKPRKLALYETYGKITDDKYYYYLYGTHQAPITAKGPFTSGLFIDGEKSNIGNYNSGTKYVFKPIDAEEDEYVRYYDDEVVDEIGQNYYITTPGGTYTHTITSADRLRLLVDEEIPHMELKDFDVYSVNWPQWGTLLNTLNVEGGLSSFHSDGAGSYYTIFEADPVQQPYPILVSITDKNGDAISTIEGPGVKIGEFLGDEGGGNFSYYPDNQIIYVDDTYNYYPYYDGFTGPEPDNYATVKRVNISNNGADVWDKTNTQWNLLSTGDNNSGGGSGGDGSSNPFILTIGSMNFDLSNGNGQYRSNGDYITSDSDFDYQMYIYNDYMTSSNVYTVRRLPFDNINNGYLNQFWDPASYNWTS